MLGTAISVRGSVPMSGARRHPDDTDSVLHLTLYGQDGDLCTLPVRRTRSLELFQEWLRRYDRYTVHGSDTDALVRAAAEQTLRRSEW